MDRNRNTFIEIESPEKRCQECHGLGEVPSGDGFNEPCRECGGGGYIYDDEGQWPDVGFGFCPDCGYPLEHHDTFGNIDYCLEAIGHPSDGWRSRQPKKAGDIYRCEKCECYWHRFDGNGELQSGYPC